MARAPDRFWYPDDDGALVASPTFEDPPTIGSSDAAAILGVSRWGGPWDVWPGIVGLTKRYSRTDDDSQRRGRRLEQVVLEWYRDDYGVELERGPDVFDPSAELLVRDGWAHTHPDAFEVAPLPAGARYTVQRDRRRRAVEIKTARWFDASTWGPRGSDQVPIDYLAQSAHHSFVTGLGVVLVAYSTGSDELRVYEIELDRALVERQGQLLQAWHEAHVVEGRPPPLDGSAACGRALARLYAYGSRDKDYRPATPREIEVVREIAELRTEIGRLEQLAGARENALRVSIGDRYGLKAPNGKSLALWFPTTTLDEQALAAAHPDLDLEAYRKPGSIDRKRLRTDHRAIEARYSREAGRSFRVYNGNLPTPDEGEGEPW